MNIIIYLVILIICMLFLYYNNKLLNKLGLTITFITMSAISLILSFKYIMISTINTSANCITYITSFISLYLLLETIQKKEVKEIINLNFIASIFISTMLYLMTIYTQSLTDTISINMTNVFAHNYRILIAYPIATILANYLIIWCYEKIKKIYDNHFISIVTIYLFVGIIEGIIYTIIAYLNILNTKAIILLILSTYMIKLVLAVIYSIIITILSKKKVIS